MKPQPSHLETSLPAEVMQTLSEGTYIQLVLSKPIEKRTSAWKKVMVRPVILKDTLHFQIALSKGQQEVHENLLPAEAVQRIVELWADHFREGYLYTQVADSHFQKTKQGTVRLKTHAPTKAKPLQAESHNRSKQYLIPEGTPCAFLEAIGVMSEAGKVKSAQYRKFRQINRYLEFINDIVPGLPKTGELQIVDFGCGKSYLTFATHYFFTEVLQREVQITGLDLKRTVVEHCQSIADQLQCRGLSFQTGDISQFDVSLQKCDLSISLHACDTATDAALASAIQSEASVIMAVPCCQHEIFQQITSKPLEGLLQHGILKEKTAALVTDALRSLALEICGYRAQVIEFIDTEHTPKNLLIKAVKRQSELSVRDLHELVGQYESLKGQFGIESFYLERALGARFRELCESSR
ncbi:SAM-dependent methyltransferase [uncultured Gimesia sp.]|uniref:class I SAM-dependent methyltransferase n=1 Tax=uncultured Gimesia sp. TaxID=1678688 RepID=UPI0030DC3C18|tara:strand:+ start:39503 stop:40732 length:1230 start_codon:yes stop_codon:yes gene_type:complete